MKNLHVTVQIRNNQIYSRRKSLGFTQVQMAEASGVNLDYFQKLENCMASPIDKCGDWNIHAKKLCSFLCEEPEVIFSEDVLSIQKNKLTAEVNKNTLLLAAQEKMMLTAGIQQIESVELSQQTRKVLSKLTTREERVLRMRFGIGEVSDHTLEEISKDFNVVPDRIRQIEAKALKKLRNPSTIKKQLKLFHEE